MVSKNLSVFLSVTNFDLNYFRTGKIEWAEIYKPNIKFTSIMNETRVDG